MADWKLSLYHKLPPFLRDVAATLRGYQLRSWRYGPETEQLVQEALERDRWTAEQWKTYQENRLARILHRAATQVPYYREQWSARRRKGDRSSWDYLENWPILTKEPLRSSPKAFVADGCDPRHMFHEHTSGTSGTPLSLWWSRQMVREWYALFEARWRRWYGVSRQSRWAILGGQLIAPVERRRPPFWVFNRALNQMYLSSYHLVPEFLPAYVKAIEGFKPDYILAYTSSVHTLAQHLIRIGSHLPVQVVITNAEPVYDYQRKIISQAFQCPVRETYGMSEAVVGASECESGNLHLWPDVGIAEIAFDGRILPHGSGQLICTGFLNEDMPLVRYRVGDTATIEPEQVGCRCHRTLPLIQSIEGRTDDLLITADGRRIGRLDPVFKASFPIQEAQVIQESLSRVRVRLVPADDYATEVGQEITTQLQARLGPVEISIELVSEIPRGPNGKFKAVVCSLPPGEAEIAGIATNA